MGQRRPRGRAGSSAPSCEQFNRHWCTFSWGIQPPGMLTRLAAVRDLHRREYNRRVREVVEASWVEDVPAEEEGKEDK
mgnify:CR=1 FL=1